MLATMKALIISPTPTHPANAGNRIHIHSLCSLLMAEGWEIDFLYLAYESFDQAAMREFFQQRLFVVPREKLFGKRPLAPYYLGRLGQRYRRWRRSRQMKRNSISEQQYKYNSEADDNFPLGAAAMIRRLNRSNSYQAVVCEYSYISKALSFFGKEVVKILDTHDCFSDRFNVYLENNLEPSWVSLYEDQEAKALDRADVVLAVQDWEKNFFERLSRTKVIKFTYVPEIRVLPARSFERKLLYFASDNEINRLTLQCFLQEIMPKLRKECAGVCLLVGGKISRKADVAEADVAVLGEFEDPGAFYASGDIVINPERGGTGYKVKALEALSYGLPYVATSKGAAGVLEPFMDHLLIADGVDAFVGAIKRLVEDAALRRELSANAVRWMERYRYEMKASLLQHIGKTV